MSLSHTFATSLQDPAFERNCHTSPRAIGSENESSLRFGQRVHARGNGRWYREFCGKHEVPILPSRLVLLWALFIFGLVFLDLRFLSKRVATKYVRYLAPCTSMRRSSGISRFVLRTCDNELEEIEPRGRRCSGKEYGMNGGVQGACEMEIGDFICWWLQISGINSLFAHSATQHWPLPRHSCVILSCFLRGAPPHCQVDNQCSRFHRLICGYITNGVFLGR